MVAPMITITIKGLSKEAHRELKKRAVTHGRSLNREAIAVLESSVRSVPVDTQAMLTRVRAVRDSMQFKGKPLDIEKIIREDRDRR
jgi:plasmid stability protein